LLISIFVPRQKSIRAEDGLVFALIKSRNEWLLTPRVRSQPAKTGALFSLLRKTKNKGKFLTVVDFVAVKAPVPRQNAVRGKDALISQLGGRS
jgi:hypothetical protein